MQSGLSKQLRGLEGSVWSVGDQALVSLGTFLTSIALARSLSPSDFGAYGVLVAAILFLNGIHSSLVTSPLSVQGAAVDRATLGRYSTASVVFTLALAVPAGLLLLAGCASLGKSSLWIWAPASLTLWQLQETMRRTLMCGLGHRRAVWGDAVSYLGQAAIIWAVCRAGSMSLERAFAIMALTSGAAAVLQAMQAGVGRVEIAEVWRLARGFWRFGSWLVYGAFLSMFCAQAFYWVLAAFHGAKETASLQAVASLLGVCHPVMFGLGNFLVPVVARAKALGGFPSAWHSARTHGFRFGLVLLPYFGILLLWPRAVLSALYGPASSYTALAGPLRLLAAAYVFIYLAQVLAIFLTGVGDARATFHAQIYAALSSVLLGLPLACILGAPGACLGMLVVNATKCAASGIYASRRRRDPQDAPRAETFLGRFQLPAALKRGC
jgi:O-antigen/teichoic acid export membrane protein